MDDAIASCNLLTIGYIADVTGEKHKVKAPKKLIYAGCLMFLLCRLLDVSWIVLGNLSASQSDCSTDVDRWMNPSLCLKVKPYNEWSRGSESLMMRSLKLEDESLHSFCFHRLLHEKDQCVSSTSVFFLCGISRMKKI